MIALLSSPIVARIDSTHRNHNILRAEKVIKSELLKKFDPSYSKKPQGSHPTNTNLLIKNTVKPPKRHVRNTSTK